LRQLVEAVAAQEAPDPGDPGVVAELKQRPVRLILRQQAVELQVGADLVDRQFSRTAPNQLWVTDITEHPTREGKVCCAVVLDAFSGRVVGWSIDASPTAALVTNALGMAIWARRGELEGLVHHSDSEYVGAGAPGLPDPYSDGRARIDGAGMLPSLLTRTPIDELLRLSFPGSVGGLGAPGEALASPTV
jgi:transposase InsO family protein